MSVQMIGLDQSTRATGPSFSRPCVDPYVAIIRPLNRHARVIDKARRFDHKLPDVPRPTCALPPNCSAPAQCA